MGRGNSFMDAVIAFTDGSCYPNPNGNGGWAFTCSYKGSTTSRYGPIANASNNSAELTAILRCLQYVPIGRNRRYPFFIFTDSEYAKNALTKWVEWWKESDEWLTSNGSPVKNREIIEEAHSLIIAHSKYREFKLRWVKGHSGVSQNEKVDKLASFARVHKATNWKITDNKNESYTLPNT